MKKIVTIFLTLAAAVFVNAQPATLDATFTPGAGFSTYVFDAELQPDGKLVVVGAFTTFDGTARNGIARLNTDGTLDTSFDPGTGFNNWVHDVVIQTDGKIIAVGSYTTFNGASRSGIARVNSDGSLDATFDPGTGFVGSARGLDLQADGKILVVGDFTSFNGTARNRIVLLNTDGSIDTGYDPGTGFNGNAKKVEIQPDGKAIIGGTTFTSYNGTAANRIIRLNADATIDASFVYGAGCNGNVVSIVIQPDSKIIVGGHFTSYDGTTINRVMRLNADGSMDVSFNPGTGANSEVRSLALQSDGSILLGGLFTTFNGAAINRIVKLYPDGSVDANFNSGLGFNSEVNAIVIQPDNKLIAGGHFTSYNSTAITRIARLDNCVNTTATDYQTACGDFTWIDGNTYSANNTTATHVISNATGCDSTITLNLLITPVADQAVSAPVSTFCDMGSATISTGSSQSNAYYYLRDDSDNSVIDGPLAGTGASLDLSTGTITATTTYNVYAETIENGLAFDGVDDEATMAAVNVAGTSFTMEFWGKRNSSGTNDYFIGQGSTATNQGLHIGFRPSNEFTFAFWANDLNTPVYTDVDWHHWAVTYDATTNARKIYRDGILVASDVAANDYTGTGTLFFGDTPWGGSNINGNMDEVRVWSEAKEQVEIQMLMNVCLTGDEPGLMAYYKMDGIPGSASVTDETANGNNGVLVNMDAATAWQAGSVNCLCSAEMTNLVTITVNNSSTGTDVQEHCESYMWIDGNLYTASNNTAIHTLTNAVGCDSVVTLNLTINMPDATTDAQTACNDYTWIDGNLYTVSNNTATHTLTNVNGCDSVVTLNLTINSPDATTDVQTHCESYTWSDGNTYTVSNNTATQTLANVNGCDSVVTLNLTITAGPVAVAVNNGDGTLSATGTGTYQWIDCGTNSPVPGATAATFTPSANGDYSVIVTDGTCDDTSACVNYNSVGLNENGSYAIQVYPNPTNGLLHINFGQELSDAYIVITNVLGEQVYAENLTGANHQLQLDQASGIYFVNVYTHGSLISTVRVIKQ